VIRSQKLIEARKIVVGDAFTRAVADVRLADFKSKHDKADRWYPAYDPTGCMEKLRAPSAAFPHSYLDHWYTDKHAYEVVTHVLHHGTAGHDPAVVEILAPLLEFLHFVEGLSTRPLNTFLGLNLEAADLYEWARNGQMPEGRYSERERALLVEWAARRGHRSTAT